MAAIDSSRPAFGSVSVAGFPGNIFSRLIARFVDWNDTRQTRNALSALTDRELDDIGLSRADIDTIA